MGGVDAGSGVRDGRDGGDGEEEGEMEERRGEGGKKWGLDNRHTALAGWKTTPV